MFVSDIASFKKMYEENYERIVIKRNIEKVNFRH